MGLTAAITQAEALPWLPGTFRHEPALSLPVITVATVLHAATLSWATSPRRVLALTLAALAVALITTPIVVQRSTAAIVAPDLVQSGIVACCVVGAAVGLQQVARRSFDWLALLMFYVGLSALIALGAGLYCMIVNAIT